MTAPLFTAEERARLTRLALRPRRRLPGDAPGRWRTGRAGPGLLFHDHRPYAHGDDPRYVDWHVAARLGDLVVKRFETEESLDLVLCVDRSQSMAGRKALLARRLAGALGHLALDALDRAHLAWLPPSAPGAAPTSYGGPRGLAKLLDDLAAAPEGGDTHLARDVADVLQRRRRRALAVLISDFHDPVDPLAGLRLLRAHGHDVVALHVVDAADVALPEGEAVRAVDAESGATVDLDVTPALLERLHAAWRRRTEAIARWCTAHDVAALAVDAARPLWETLRELAQRGVVGRR
jgi:uncharacterized protein (DUF58 family)